MKHTILIIIFTVAILAISIQPLLAAGEIRKLKGIADSMSDMDKVSAKEGKNYQRTRDFVSSQDIREGLSKESISASCGQPVAVAQDGTKWVYKPPTSTFFKGEKIYFLFDKDGNLISWEQVYQD